MNQRCTKPEKKVSPEDYNDEYGHVRWRPGAEFDHGTYIGDSLKRDPDQVRNVAYTVQWILRGISQGMRDFKAPSVNGSLDSLDILRQARLTVEDETLAAVAKARANEASWSQIGSALGISKQAAQQKYGRPVPASTQIDPNRTALSL